MAPTDTELLLRVNGIQAAYGAEFGMASPRADEIRAGDPYRQANVSYSLLQRQAGRIVRHTLVDVGMGVVPSLLELEQAHGVHVVHEALISHPHFDHFAGLHWLAECAARNGQPEQPRPLPVYASRECWETGPDRMFAAISKWKTDRLEHRPLQPGGTQRFGQLSVTPFAVEHGPTAPGALGFVAECGGRKIVLTCDFLHIPEPEAAILQKPDVCLMEGNSWHPAPQTNHQSIREGVKLLDRWQPRRTYFIHYSGATDCDYRHEPIYEPLDSQRFARELAALAPHHDIRPARHGMILGEDEAWP